MVSRHSLGLPGFLHYSDVISGVRLQYLLLLDALYIFEVIPMAFHFHFFFFFLIFSPGHVGAPCESFNGSEPPDPRIDIRLPAQLGSAVVKILTTCMTRPGTGAWKQQPIFTDGTAETPVEGAKV